MQGKINIGLIVGVVVLLGLNVFQFVWWNNTNKELSTKYTSEIAALEQTIAGYGTEVQVYTVSAAVKAGDEIKEENIEPMKMYSSLMNDQYVTDTSMLVGKFFKIAVNPGTPIMQNMAMEESLDDTTRDKDVMLDNLPVGTKVGDYIDIRITFPYGDDYLVLSHKRIYNLGEGTIKLHLTEYEWAVYTGAMVDYSLNKDYGATIYATKYVEPGLQQDAVAYYAVPSNISALLQKNPNILAKDKEGAMSLDDWREGLEKLLMIFRDSEDTVANDGNRIKANIDEYNEKIKSDSGAYTEQEAAKAAADSEAAEKAKDAEYWSDDGTSSPTDASAPSTESSGGTDASAPSTESSGGTVQ